MTDAPTPAVRSQLLIAEQASLVAARSTTQAEVLTRITIFLTLVSAGLVSLGLLGQATGFQAPFAAFAVTILAVVSIVGMLTQIRVTTASHEDLGFVLALNRLRSGYLELDPGLEPYLMTSAHDDLPGSLRTYDLIGSGSDQRHVLGSTMALITLVTSAMVGLLAAAVASLAGGVTWVLFAVGLGAGILYFAGSLLRLARGYRRVWARHVPLNPTE